MTSVNPACLSPKLSVNRDNSGHVSKEHADENAYQLQSVVLSPRAGHVSQDIFVVSEQAEEISNRQQTQVAIIDNNQEVNCSAGLVCQTDLQIQSAPKHLHFFLQLMYKTGLSTYDPASDAKKNPTWTLILMLVLQRMMFWSIVVFAILHSSNAMKLNWFLFQELGGISRLVDVGFWVLPILAGVCMGYIFGVAHGVLREMLDSLDAVDAGSFQSSNLGNKRHAKHASDSKSKSDKVYKTITALVVASMIICFCKSCAGDVTSEWSVKDKVLEKSFEMGFGINVWKSKTMLDPNATKKLRMKFGSNVTWTTVTMGLTMFLMEFSNHIKLEIAIDLLIVTAWCLQMHVGNQAEKVKNFDFKTLDDLGDDCANLDDSNGMWAQYKLLKLSNQTINRGFSSLLTTLHIYNVMQGAYFLMHLLDNELTGMKAVFFLYDIVRLSYAYYVAKQSHAYNHAYEKWIIDWAMNSRDEKFVIKFPAMLAEVKSEPLGLGTGELVVGETFILKIAGMVGSLFVLQVDNQT